MNWKLYFVLGVIIQFILVLYSATRGNLFGVKVQSVFGLLYALGLLFHIVREKINA